MQEILTAVQEIGNAWQDENVSLRAENLRLAEENQKLRGENEKLRQEIENLSVKMAELKENLRDEIIKELGIVNSNLREILDALNVKALTEPPPDNSIVSLSAENPEEIRPNYDN